MFREVTEQMKRKYIAYRRKREGKTDYKKRRLLLTSGKPRLVIRKSLKHITCQIIAYQPAGDKILLSVHSKQLEKLGWKYNTGNIPSAYLTGLLLGKKAQEKNIKEAIIDMGRESHVKGNRISAAIKGVLDGGMSIPASSEMAGDEKRLEGNHIATYAKNSDKAKMFSKNMKQNADPEKISDTFNSIKQKILG